MISFLSEGETRRRISVECLCVTEGAGVRVLRLEIGGNNYPDSGQTRLKLIKMLKCDLYLNTSRQEKHVNAKYKCSVIGMGLD